MSGVNAEFGIDLQQQFAKQINEFREIGWLETPPDGLRLTEHGLLFSNEVFASFLA